MVSISVAFGIIGTMVIFGLAVKTKPSNDPLEDVGFAAAMVGLCWFFAWFVSWVTSW